MTRDSARSRVYDAERMVHRVLDRAGGTAHTVQIAGARLTVPAEARFASIDDVAAYTARVLALRTVAERFPRARLPVRVRSRRGQRAAHYERREATVAVPESEEGRWALRELVVLHEIAHHLDEIGDPAHGPSFVQTLIELAGLVMGPEIELIYRVMFDGV